MRYAQKGVSIVEVLVAVSIFVVSVSSVYAGIQFANRAVSRAGDKTEAAFLIEEGFEAVKHLRDVDWQTRIATKNSGYEYCLDFGGGDDGNEFGLSVGTSSMDRVLHMHFDETSWNGTAGEVKDDSGNNMNGTLVGGSLSAVAGRNANYGNAAPLNFPYYAEVADNAALDIAGDITLEAWVNIDNTVGGKRRAIFKGAGVNGDPYYLGVETGGSQFKPLFHLGNATGGYVDLYATNAVSRGVWHHLVGTRQGSTITLYVDGVQDGSATLSGALTQNANNLRVGTAANPSANNAIQLIDEVSIYKRALSADEVREHYKAGALCRKVNGKFQRTVIFQNACRDGSQNITGPTTGTLGSQCASGNFDAGTKYAEMRIDWESRDADKTKYSIPTQFYFADIFTCKTGI